MLTLILYALLTSNSFQHKPLQWDEQRTCYADLKRFGYAGQFARLQVFLSVIHEAAMSEDVQAANTPERYNDWVWEVKTRREAWAWLAMALEPLPECGSRWLWPGEFAQIEAAVEATLNANECTAGSNRDESIWARLVFAGQLRGAIGEDAWALGLMPSPVPTYSTPIGPRNVTQRDD